MPSLTPLPIRQLPPSRPAVRPGRRATASRFRLPLVCLAAMLVLSGCGFKLRGEVMLPPEMQFLRLELVEAGPRIRPGLVAALERGGVTLVEEPGAEVAVLRIPVNVTSTQALTISQQARVSEYTVRHRVELELRGPDGSPLLPREEIILERDFVFDRRDALGVAGQEETLLRDLEREMVRAILRRIGNLERALDDDS